MKEKGSTTSRDFPSLFLLNSNIKETNYLDFNQIDKNKVTTKPKRKLKK